MLIEWTPLISGLIAFVLTILLGPGTIYYLRRLKFGQQIRSDGPQTHLKKKGTPSMGGVLIIAAIIVAVLLTTRISNNLAVAFFAFIGFGIIGLIDDALKIVAKRSLGLRARDKLVAQLGISLLVALYALNTSSIGTTILVPFASLTITIPTIIYVIFSVVVIVGASNAVNITDGLDGLAAGSTAIASIAYGIIVYLLGHYDLVIFLAAVAGACLGFAWFNAHPAQVFMGDTGSLGLGAALGTVAVLSQTSLFLPIIGGLFVIETLSVIIQVAYFRVTKGNRVFRMAPLHHHFEVVGWSEPKVMIRFWLVAILCAAIGLLAFMH